MHAVDGKIRGVLVLALDVRGGESGVAGGHHARDGVVESRGTGVDHIPTNDSGERGRESKECQRGLHVGDLNDCGGGMSRDDLL
jgi:hypothetical protein